MKRLILFTMMFIAPSAFAFDSSDPNLAERDSTINGMPREQREEIIQNFAIQSPFDNNESGADLIRPGSFGSTASEQLGGSTR